MEKVQEKRALRIVAAIMFILVCVVQIVSNIRYMADNTWLFRSAGTAKNIVMLIVEDLIYSIAIVAMIASGLLAKKKSNGLRFTFGGLFAVLLAAEIVCLIGEISFKSALRTYWPEFVMLTVAAVCLFAIRHISVAGVGFSMLAWNRLAVFIDYVDRGADAEYIIFTLVMLIATALAAVVCFLNDSEKRRGAAVPLGIIAIVFLSIWFVYQDARIADTLSRYSGTRIIADTLLNLCNATFLFLGTLFAVIAIAFRKKQVPVKNFVQPQQYQPWQQPQPQYQPWQQPQPQYQPWQQPQPQPYAQPQAWQPPVPAPAEDIPQEVPARTPAPEESSWTCPVCGTVSSNSAKFCMQCGTKRP